MAKRSIVQILLAIVLLVCLFPITSYAATQDVDTRPNVVIQEPVPVGQETVWVNVTRWVRGIAKAPTEATLRNIINSYRTGGWRTAGSPVIDGSGQWWQKLARIKYSSGGGVMITWHTVDGCLVDNHSGTPLGGSSQICDCWINFSNYFISHGVVKPAKCR